MRCTSGGKEKEKKRKKKRRKERKKKRRKEKKKKNSSRRIPVSYPRTRDAMTFASELWELREITSAIRVAPYFYIIDAVPIVPIGDNFSRNAIRPRDTKHNEDGARESKPAYLRSVRSRGGKFPFRSERAYRSNILLIICRDTRYLPPRLRMALGLNQR